MTAEGGAIMLQRGTYVRESGGGCLLYHSPVSWNDASYALSRWLNRESTSSLSEWRRVDQPEADEVWAWCKLGPGESIEYDDREPCECSDEYGPCELHCEVLAVREGASCRTADELLLVYLDDMEALGQCDLSPWGREVRAVATTRLEANRSLVSGTAWIDDPDLVDSLNDVVNQVGADSDYLTFWDDGYRIVKPSAEYWEEVK